MNPAVCIIAGGFRLENQRLQPWRYLSELSFGLASQGIEVSIVCERGNVIPGRSTPSDVTITNLSSVRNPIWRSNIQLQETLDRLSPDVILWHVGLISFLHQNIKGPANIPIIGILSSPIYKFSDLARLGYGKVFREHHLTSVHLIASLIPPQIFNSRMLKSDLTGLVVQTKTTRDQLTDLGLRSVDIQVIPPGVSEVWCKPPEPMDLDRRYKLGFKPDDIVIVFFGSPSSLRGAITLVEAFSIAKESECSPKLLLLCRRHPHELVKEYSSLIRKVAKSCWKDHIKVIDGYLYEKELVGILSVIDVIALPFELVPSDAPLSIFESITLGKPVITTNVACIPEIVSGGEYYLAEPADPVSLARVILQSVHDIHQRKLLSYERPHRSWREAAKEWKHLILSV